MTSVNPRRSVALAFGFLGGLLEGLAGLILLLVGSACEFHGPACMPGASCPTPATSGCADYVALGPILALAGAITVLCVVLATVRPRWTVRAAAGMVSASLAALIVPFLLDPRFFVENPPLVAFGFSVLALIGGLFALEPAPLPLPRGAW